MTPVKISTRSISSGYSSQCAVLASKVPLNQSYVNTAPVCEATCGASACMFFVACLLSAGLCVLALCTSRALLYNTSLFWQGASRTSGRTVEQRRPGLDTQKTTSMYQNESANSELSVLQERGVLK